MEIENNILKQRLKNVYFIWGSGKTTIANALAEKCGCFVYHTDYERARHAHSADPQYQPALCRNVPDYWALDPEDAKKYVYYVCSENKAHKNVCSSHSIRDTELEKLVLLSTQQHIQAVIDLQSILEITDTAPLRTAEAQKVQRQLEKKQNELERYNRLLMSLYESLTDGIITREEYKHLKESYSEQSAEAEKQLLALQEILEDIWKHGSSNQSWMDEIKAHNNITSLDRETVVTLIDRKRVKTSRVPYLNLSKRVTSGILSRSHS